MDKIYKVNSNKSNTHICKYCYSYIGSIKCKSILKQTEVSNYNKIKDLKCYICSRFIKEINSGPNIIYYIKDNKSANDLILNIGKYKVWYFNDIYDNFGYYLRDRFKFTHGEIRNINQAIYELYALPNINIINEKAEDIYNQSIAILNLP
jgi:hypothetical protein